MLPTIAALAHAGTLDVPADHATIAAALQAAEHGDVISIAPGTYVETVTVDRDVTLEGSPGTEIRGSEVEFALRVERGRSVTLRGLSFDGAGMGRCVVVDADASLVVEGSLFHDCWSILAGGAIASGATGSSLTVRDSTFRDNTAPSGPHIGVQQADSVEIEGCIFSGGQAELNGGAVRVFTTESLSLDRSTFEDNAAGANGGALIVSDVGTAKLSRSMFCDNFAVLDGGAISVYGEQTVVDLVGSVVVRNTSGGNGGGVYASGLQTSTTNVHYVKNESMLGHAVYTSGLDRGSHVNALVAFNASSADDGAALHWADQSEGDADYVLFHDNGADDTNRRITNEIEGDPMLPPGPGEMPCDPALLVPEGWPNPTVDAGDPAILDLDGTRSDIGAFGGSMPFDAVDADGDSVTFPEDCDDRDASVFPGAPEVCNGRDDDCDGEVPPGELDLDGDGVSACGGDCNDASAEVAPGQPEVVCDGLDNDCDAATVDAPQGDCADAVLPRDDAAVVLPGPWFCGTRPGSAVVGMALCVALLTRRRGRRSETT